MTWGVSLKFRGLNLKASPEGTECLAGSQQVPRFQRSHDEVGGG